MSGPARWTVAGASSVVAFALVLWMVRAASWGWLPSDDGDRWAVGTASGAVVAAAVLSALTWWTSRPASPSPLATSGPRVTQAADARDDAVIDQAVGHRVPHGTTSASATPSAGHLTQRAKGRGRSQIRQTGGDDHP